MCHLAVLPGLLPAALGERAQGRPVLVEPTAPLPPKGALLHVPRRLDDVKEVAEGADVARVLLELAAGGLLEVGHRGVLGVYRAPKVVAVL